MHASWETAALLLALAVLLDWFVGEYPNILHPVVWIGKSVNILLAGDSWCRRLACTPDTAGEPPAPREPQGWWLQFLFGTVLVIVVCSLTAGLTILAMWWARENYLAEIIVGSLLLKSSFALRALGRAALGVAVPLHNNDLPKAREALRSLCSRDPSELQAKDLLAGTVESLAENLCDSFVAPIFYYLLLGLPGAMVYRAINTMDAMIGYRGRYEALGKTAARLDDMVNWVPARLTAFLLLLAGWMTGQNLVQGWRILRRDGGKTPSPNAGRPMAAMAGLLGVRLEKIGVYVLGEPGNDLTPATVRTAWKVVVTAAALMLGLAFAFFGAACGFAHASGCGVR